MRGVYRSQQQGRVPPRVMEKAIGILFAVIGIAMVWLVARELKLI